MKFMSKKRVQGSISLLLVAILLPTMLFSALMVDISRLNLAKSMVSSAGDIALNSALANYDTVLKDVYGLFAISQNQDDMEEDVRRYFEETLSGDSVVSQDDGDYLKMLLGGFSQSLITDGKPTVNFMDMSIDGFSANGVKNSALSNPLILEKQIVEYMKYRGPYEFGMSFIDSLKTFEKVQPQANVVESKVVAQEKTKDVNNACKKLYEKIAEYEKKYAATPNEFSKDNNTVQSLDERVGSYKRDWVKDGIAMNYVDIDWLIVEFDITRYTGANKPVTINTTIDKNDSSYGNESSRSKGIFESKINGALNSTIKSNFQNAKFFKKNYIGENGFFTNIEKADEQFKEYEKYLRGTSTVITKAAVEQELSDFEQLRKALSAFYYWSNKEISACTEAIDAADKEKTRLGGIKTQKEADRDKLNQETIPDDGVNLTKAEDACSSKETAIFKRYVDEYKNDNVNKTVKDTFKAAVEDEDGEYKDNEDRTKIYDCIQAYDTLKLHQGQSAKLEAEILQLGGDISDQQDIIDKNEKTKEDLETAQTNMQNQYDTAKTKYEGLDELINGAIATYESYYKAAHDSADKMVQEINKDIKAVKTKLEALRADLDSAETLCDEVVKQIGLYKEQLNNWKKSVDEYEKGNESDSFSESNLSEIEEMLKTYDEDDVDDLKKKIQEEKKELDDYLAFFNADGNYKFGNQKIIEITSYALAKKAIEKSNSFNSEVKDKAGLNSVELGTFFGHIYSTGSVPKNDKGIKLTTDIYTLLPESDCVELPLLKFAAYLKTTYGSATEDKALEESYNETKEASKENGKIENSSSGGKNEGSGGKEESSSSSDPGYSYKEKDLSGLNLPSKADYSEKEVKEKEVNSDKTSSSLSGQKTTASDILGKIGSVLENGRDKLFTLEYIFGNFSYATIAQDNRNQSKDSSKALKDYTSETMSGYKINDKNNYIYGAEIEYMLYGKTDPEKNITYAKTMIYAIRFVCNCIFAFSDSEIRTTTQAIGMAVQAATMGFVPFQVVQIILQLGLTAAESAIDLDQMMDGKKVVIMKSKDTWTMSISGAGKAALEAAKNKVKDVANTLINDAVSKVQDGITSFIDTSADKIGEKADELITSVEDASASMASDITNQMFGMATNIINEKINELLYLSEAEYEDASKFTGAIRGKFTSIRTEVKLIGNNFQGDIAQAVWGDVEAKILSVVDDTENKLFEEFGSLTEKGEELRRKITTKIYSVINNTKDAISAKVGSAISEVSETVKTKAKALVGDYQAKVNKLVEDKTEEAKAEILKKTDDFIDSAFGKLDKSSNTGKLNNATSMKSSGSLKNSIKFGYKEYLMLFTFVGLVVDGNAVVARLGDVIQMNVMKAQAGSPLHHNKGEEFRLNNSYTYVSITANMDFGMFVLDAPLFKGAIDALNDDIEAGTIGDGNKINMDDGHSTIKYTGLAGY